MAMIAAPPSGSRIHIEELGSGISIAIPPSRSGVILRFFPAIFLVCWLVGWSIGFTNVLEQIGKDKAKAFLIAWLVMWTIGGGFALVFAVRLLRPPSPERFTLQQGVLTYDSGHAPFSMMDARAFTSEMLRPRRRIRCDFSSDELATLRLREGEGQNRLTIDCGSERVDLGRWATEVEREWLFAALKQESR